MNTDNFVRVVLWMPRPLYGALKRAADAANEPMPDALKARLATSLTVSQAVVRSGCAGRGEAALSVSPTLDH